MASLTTTDLIEWGIALLLIYVVLRFGFPIDRGKTGATMLQIMKYVLGAVLLYHLVACNPITPEEREQPPTYTKRMRKLDRLEERYHQKFLEASKAGKHQKALRYDRKAARVGEELERLLDHQERKHFN